jgi:hypothetical protein
VEWIHVVQDRDQWRAAENKANELSGSIIAWEFLGI